MAMAMGKLSDKDGDLCFTIPFLINSNFTVFTQLISTTMTRKQRNDPNISQDHSELNNACNELVMCYYFWFTPTLNLIKHVTYIILNVSTLNQQHINVSACAHAL